MIPAVYVHCGFGALLVVLALPLALRRVPLNRAYGIRSREAMSSPARWLDINAYAGRLFAGYGALLVCFGYLMRKRAPPATSVWSPVFIAGPLALSLVVLPVVRSYARRRVQGGV